MTKHLITNTKGDVLFQAYGYTSINPVLEGAVKDRVKLTGAVLSDTDLRGAYLYGAELQHADMSGCNLNDADMSEANLTGANLTGADLISARLSGANLTGANLSGANLSRANVLAVNFTGANLRDANLSDIKADFFDVLQYARSNEIAGLRDALVEGRVNGSMYTGTCACLIGTIANIRETSPWTLGALGPDLYRPAERWFLGINTGDTPESNQVSSITLEWLDLFILVNV